MDPLSLDQARIFWFVNPQLLIPKLKVCPNGRKRHTLPLPIGYKKYQLCTVYDSLN